MRRSPFLPVLTLLAFGAVGTCHAASHRAEADDPENWATVAEVSTRRLAKDAHDQKAWADLLRAQIELGDLERADATLKHWRDKGSPPSAISYLLEGQLALQKEDAARAMVAAGEYVRLAPKDDAGWRFLSSAYEEQKDWTKAADAMGHAVSLRPDVDGYVQRAKLQMHAHEWERAQADIRQANRLDAADPAVRALYPVFERASTWLPKVTALDRAVKSQPRDASLLLDRAEWLRWNGLKEIARDDIAAAFHLNPKSLRARFWYGLTQELPPKDDATPDEAAEAEAKKTDPQGVMPMLTAKITLEFARELKTLDASNDPEARAQFLLRDGQPLLALGEVQDIEGSPAKAQALLELGRLPEGGRAARRATELHADSAAAWLALGRWELAGGNYREALDAAQRSAKLHKSPEAEALRKTAQQRLSIK